MPEPKGAPSSTAEEETAGEVPVFVPEALPNAEPAMIGKEGLIIDMMVLVLPFGLLYSLEGGVCRSRLRVSTMSDGM